MFTKIRNITKRLVLIRLNSGRTLFVGPGAVSGEIRDQELSDNTMVAKLRDRHVIALFPFSTRKREATTAKVPGNKTGKKSATKGGK
jgi:hypothetical protein